MSIKYGFINVICVFAILMLFAGCSGKTRNELKESDNAMPQRTADPLLDDAYGFFPFIKEYRDSISPTDREPREGELSKADTRKKLVNYLKPLGLDSYAKQDISCTYTSIQNGAFWKFSFSDENLMFYADIDATTGVLLSIDAVGTGINESDEKNACGYAEQIINALNSSTENIFPYDGEHYLNEFSYSQNGVDKKAKSYTLYSSDKKLMLNVSFIASSDKKNSFTAGIFCYEQPKSAERMMFRADEYLDVDELSEKNCGMDEKEAKSIVDKELSSILHLLGKEKSADNPTVKEAGFKRVAANTGIWSLWCFEVTADEAYTVFVDPELGHISCVCFESKVAYSADELTDLVEKYAKLLEFPHMNRRDVYSLSDISCVGEFFYDDYYDELGEESVNWGICAAQDSTGTFSLFFTRKYPRI